MHIGVQLETGTNRGRGRGEEDRFGRIGASGRAYREDRCRPITDPSDRNQTTFDLRRGYPALLVKTLSPALIPLLQGWRAGTSRCDSRGPLRSGSQYRPFPPAPEDFWIRDLQQRSNPQPQVLQLGTGGPNETMGAPAYMAVHGPGYGRWRLEIEMDKPAANEYVLNLLKPTLSPAETMHSDAEDRSERQVRSGH